MQCVCEIPFSIPEMVLSPFFRLARPVSFPLKYLTKTHAHDNWKQISDGGFTIQRPTLVFTSTKEGFLSPSNQRRLEVETN
jgi:hypothetical protein